MTQKRAYESYESTAHHWTLTASPRVRQCKRQCKRECKRQSATKPTVCRRRKPCVLPDYCQPFVGTFTYQGEWLNGQRHGTGTSYRPDGSVAYCGEWAGDQPHGVGSYWTPWGQPSTLGGIHHGLLYSGKWVHGEPRARAYAYL